MIHKDALTQHGETMENPQYGESLQARRDDYCLVKGGFIIIIIFFLSHQLSKMIKNQLSGVIESVPCTTHTSSFGHIDFSGYIR